MTKDSTLPIFGHALDQPSAFTHENLIRDVRPSRHVPSAIVFRNPLIINHLRWWRRGESNPRPKSATA